MHIGEMEIRIDPPQKRTPGSPRSRGFYRLLPQLVGSSVRAAGCRGMVAARMGAFDKVLFHWRQPASTPVNT
jgi:hypothetical protein